VVGMVRVGSRSSFEWWYFQEDWSSFEFSFFVFSSLKAILNYTRSSFGSFLFRK
jgi:hypothetical protein